MSVATLTDPLLAREAVCADQLPPATGAAWAAQRAVLLYVEARIRETGFLQIPCAVDSRTSQKVAVLAWDLPGGDQVDGPMVETACDELVDAGLLTTFQQWWVPCDRVRARALARGPIGARWWQPDDQAETAAGRFWKLTTLRRLLVEHLDAALADSERGTLDALVVAMAGVEGRSRRVGEIITHLVADGYGAAAARVLAEVSRRDVMLRGEQVAAVLAGVFAPAPRSAC